MFVKRVIAKNPSQAMPPEQPVVHVTTRLIWPELTRSTTFVQT